jgi:NitT/TauT family transport system ATP-binding protein
VSALENITLRVAAGEFLCVVGPSGCGKTTLLNLIAGFDQPTSGVIAGHVNEQQSHARCAVIFQELGLFPWLTVRQNVEFGMRMEGLPRREREQRTSDTLELVRLLEFQNHYIYQLSGGMKQRVALARALTLRRDLLLLDEPFAALDAQARDFLHDELERIWAATRSTIIFVTHNVREAVRLGDRVIVLTSRPGTVKAEMRFELPRPRHIEDVAVARGACQVLSVLRDELAYSTAQPLATASRKPPSVAAGD